MAARLRERGWGTIPPEQYRIDMEPEFEEAGEEKADSSKVKQIMDQVKSSISAETAQHQFSKLLGNISQNFLWQSTAVRFWQKLRPEDREKLYKKGDPTFINLFLKSGPLTGVFEYNDIKLKALGNYFARTARLLVQHNMLPHPETMSKNEVVKDIDLDKNSMKNLLDQIELLLKTFGVFTDVPLKGIAAKRLKTLKESLLKAQDFVMGIAARSQKTKKAA